MDLTFNEYISGAADYRRTYPAQRLGQSYCNYLSVIGRDDIRNAVTNTYLDPFNRDDMVGEFLTFVMVKW